MTELILLRHGETEWNRELRFQGQVDVPLNATGHAQAQRLAQRLAGEPIDHLVSSDLSRARQTADPFARQVQASRGIGLDVDAALREQAFGRIDGMRVEDIKRDHADVWAGWTQFQSDYVVPEGESTRQFHARVMSALWQLVASHPGKTLAVVTHGGVLDIIYRQVHRLPSSHPRNFPIPNAALNWLVHDASGWRIEHWADTRHLDGAALDEI